MSININIKKRKTHTLSEVNKNVSKLESQNKNEQRKKNNKI